MLATKDATETTDNGHARKLTTRIMAVTPAQAETWLARNVGHNRPVSKGLVDSYARDMVDGRWLSTGDAIRFSTAGDLIDGQHRLLAIVKTGVTIKDVVVITGLAPDAIDAIDTGRSRTTAHVLKMRGFANQNQLAAAARTLLIMRNGALGNARTGRVSPGETLALLKRHPKLEDAIASAKGALGPHFSVAVATLYCANYLLDRGEDAASWIEVFKTGTPSRAGCPAHAWRERTLRKRAAGTHLTRQAMIAGTVHSWNLFARGESVTQFRIPDEITLPAGVRPKDI